MLFYHRHLFWSRLVITLVFIPCVVTGPAAISLPPRGGGGGVGGRRAAPGLRGRRLPPSPPPGRRCEGRPRPPPPTPPRAPAAPAEDGSMCLVWLSALPRSPRPPRGRVILGHAELARSAGCGKEAPAEPWCRREPGERKCRPQFSINPDTSKVNKAGQGRASREGREEASDRRLSRAEPGLFPARE